MLMPIEHEVLSVWPAIWNGRASDLMIFRRHLRGVLRLLQAFERDDEFVAAQPRERVAFADAVLHPVGHFLQQQIADLVAERVVDVLEPVEVDEQQRQRLAGAPRGTMPCADGR